MQNDRHIAYAFGLAALLAVGVFVGYMTLLSMQVLPRLALAPGWTLRDLDGLRLTSESMRGKVVVYTFASPADEVATHGVMRALQTDLEDTFGGGIPVRLLTIALGAPDARTLQSMATTAGADTSRWLFATAAPAALQNVVLGGFSAPYETLPDGSIRAEPMFVVVDGLGFVRSVYRYDLPASSDLAQDVRSVVHEAEAATGAARYAYEAAHLFSCYSIPPL